MTKHVMLRKLMITALVALYVLPALGQSMRITDYSDPVWEEEHLRTGRHVPYRFIREANVKYSKRIERVIDTRQKQNKVMHWPRNSFNEIIWAAVMKDQIDEWPRINAYADDQLDSVISRKAIRDKVDLIISTQVQDPAFPDDPYAFITVDVPVPFEPAEIKKYRIMEEWIFDHNYSDFRPTIIAIAPIYTIKTETMIDLGEAPLFWVRMADLRPIIAQQPVFNAKNNAARLSFDQFFQMRMFASVIVKESNVYDLDINGFEEFRDDGVAALLEADRIKNDLFVVEHDLWEY